MKKVLLGMLLGILLCGVGLGIYYYFFKEEPKDSVKEEKVEEVKEEQLDVNSNLVQELYSYVKNTSGLLNKKASDFDSATKLSYAERLIFPVDRGSIRCADVERAKTSGTVVADYCGSDNIIYNHDEYNLETAFSVKIEEKVMKRYVEKMFGPNTYERVEQFVTLNFRQYRFDDKSQSYVEFIFPGGGTGLAFEENLVSSIKKEYNLELTVEWKLLDESEKGTEHDLSGIYKHIFKQNEDGSYYWVENQKLN